MKRRHALKCLVPLAGLPLSRPLWAQDGFPSRPMRIIVSSTPGSATDLAGRMVAEVLGAKYGQTVNVENKPGAGGVIGMQAAAAAVADGHTITTGGLGHNVIPPVTIRGLPLDIPKALLPLAQVAEFVNVLVVRKDHPANNLQELLQHLKAQSKAPQYGSNGVGSSSHLTSELFALRSGIKLMHVPFTGAGNALMATATGDLDVCFMNMPPTLPMVKAGKLKVLGVTSGYRARQLPDVPTLQEQGLRDFEVTSWLGMYAPAAVPPAILAKLSDDIVAGLSRPEYQARIVAAGFEPKVRGAREFAAFNQAELERWGDIARRANIAVDYGRG